MIKWLLQKTFGRSSYFYQTLKAYRRFGFSKPELIDSVMPLLEAYNQYRKGEVSFVQIGSNDGLSGDPLHPFIVNYPWQGVLVEPMPTLFSTLLKTYQQQSSRLRFANMAVGNSEGELPFYSVSNEDGALPDWISQLSSFNKEVILKHADYVPDIADRIRVNPVPTTTFSALLSSYQIGGVDLLHTDTEGFDYEILKTVDLRKIQPDIILFEQKHIGLPELRSYIRLLREEGYRVFHCKSDCIAIKKTIDIQR